MNIRDLQYFLAVAELEHFGHAAEQCNVSQPTLSGQIKKLEEQLEVKLFERSNRSVMLTEVGRDIARAARRAMLEVDGIYAIARSSRDPMSGNFRLGGFPTLASYIFPSLVPRIKDAMPNLRLILIEEKTADLLEKVHQGDIDAALLALPVEDDSLMVQELFKDEFVLAVPPEHELTQHKTIDQAILKNYPLLLLEEGHCMRDQALDVCQLHNIAEQQDFRATSMETLRQMVKAGTGITFMPKIAVEENEQGIHFIPFKAPAPRRTIGLVWRKTTVRKQVIEQIISSFGDSLDTTN